MSKFYAQLHLHTAESSACGRDGAEAMMRACAGQGYGLVVVTDHFFNANTTSPRNLPWPERVGWLMKGYRAAKKAGDKLGVAVLFGWETDQGGPEILTYGLGEEYLLTHPDIAEWDLERYARETRAAGAFLAHAHPFRQAYYIDPFRPRPELYDAIEVYNAHHHHAGHSEWDAQALRLAHRHGSLMTAGADAHKADEVGFGAMELPWPVADMDELIAALRSGRARVIEKL